MFNTFKHFTLCQRIEVSPLPGAYIGDLAAEMILLSEAANATVTATFNGFAMKATPFDRVSTMIEGYREHCARKTSDAAHRQWLSAAGAEYR